MNNNENSNKPGCGLISIIAISSLILAIILDIANDVTPFWIYIIIIILLIYGILTDSMSNMELKRNELKSQGLDMNKFFPASKYLTGYHAYDTPTENLFFYITDENLRIYKPDYKLLFSIDLSNISNIYVEDKTTIQSRVGFKRLLVAGIFAFAMKKKEKNELYYLIIEYKRQDFKNEIYFEYEGSDKLKLVNEAKNKIQNAVIKSRK